MKMKALTLEKIAEVTGGKLVGPRSCRNDKIEGVSTDTRQLENGYLFVCIKGAKVDGHDFAEKAIERGAICRLAERELNDGYPYVLVSSTLQALKDLAEYYRSLFKIPFVGVIGSVGKTTAKEMVAHVLGRKYCILKTPENLNNEIGVPLTLLSVREEHEAAVVEMGISDFGEMSRLARMVRPDVCVMTNIGYCHLEKLQDLNGVLRAKSEVFRYMKKDGTAVLNGDDELLREFDPGVRKVLFGMSGKFDVYAEHVENLGFDGVSCDICMDNSRIFTLIPAFGIHIVYGALAAAAVGRTLGISDEDILRGIADYHPVGGRANVTDTGCVTLIDDCYNANPNSMAASLRSLSAIRSLSGKQGNRVAILGDMKELGDDSAQLHYSIGRLAAELGIDEVLCCGDEAKNIYDGYIAAGGKKGYHFAEKEQLMDDLSAFLGRNDVVLVKASHSMEFPEIVKAIKNTKF